MSASREIRQIARIVAEHSKQIRGLSGGPQLAHSTIEDGAIKDRDADGTLRAIIGRQHDGTHTIRHVDGPEPPQPTAPAVEVDGPVLRVAWDGQFAAGEQVPEDFSRVDVHVTAGDRETVAGNLTTREGSAVVVKAQQSGMHTVTLVARSLSGKSSAASEPVEVDVTVPSFTGAIEAVQLSADGKNVVTYASVPPTATDAGTEGDTWWVNEARLRDPEDPESEEYVAITEQWRHDGTQWVAVELAHEVIASVDLGTATVGFLHGKRIVSGTIDAEQLRATAIDGMVITGATFQTSHEHPKALMGLAGFHITDPDGADIVSLTANPESTGGNYLGIMSADGSTLANISSDGTLSGHGLNIEADPVFMGEPLIGTTLPENFASTAPAGGLLDFMPRGIVARGYRSLSGGLTASGGIERELMELSYRHHPGRIYELTISPFALTLDANTRGVLSIYRIGAGGRPIMRNSDLLYQQEARSGSTTTTHSFGATWYDVAFIDGDEVVSYLITFRSYGGNSVPPSATFTQELRAYVKDLGLPVAETGLNRDGTRSFSGGSDGPTPPPTEEKKNYTKTYTATGVRNWRGGSPLLPDADMIQGTGRTGVIFRSAIQFPSMTADLSGATITSIRAYLYFSYWQENSGGTADIHLHGNATLTTTFPSTFVHAVSVPGWPKPGGMWVDIPSQFWAGFKSGQYRGIGLGKADGGDYGYGPWADAKLEIKYTR